MVYRNINLNLALNWVLDFDHPFAKCINSVGNTQEVQAYTHIHTHKHPQWKLVGWFDLYQENIHPFAEFALVQ